MGDHSSQIDFLIVSLTISISMLLNPSAVSLPAFAINLLNRPMATIAIGVSRAISSMLFSKNFHKRLEVLKHQSLVVSY